VADDPGAAFDLDAYSGAMDAISASGGS
jgi:hypothetical protein